MRNRQNTFMYSRLVVPGLVAFGFSAFAASGASAQGYAPGPVVSPFAAPYAAPYEGRSVQPGYSPSDDYNDRDEMIDESPSFAHPEAPNNGTGAIGGGD